jgi:hypothetical protein
MKKVKFYNVPNLIGNHNVKITFDGDKKDLRLHLDEMFHWGAKTKKEYEKACKSIDLINFKGKGWNVYAWYDVSSFQYWMKDNQEQNYISISISFDNENVLQSELPIIYSSLDEALLQAEALQFEYSYNPMFI